jgi:anti-sigma-K factor RskA
MRRLRILKRPRNSASRHRQRRSEREKDQEDSDDRHGKLNWRRAIGAARAAVATMAACLSRAARERFTADGLLRTQTNDHCALARIRAFASMSPIGIFRT